MKILTKTIIYIFLSKSKTKKDPVKNWVKNRDYFDLPHTQSRWPYLK